MPLSLFSRNFARKFQRKCEKREPKASLDTSMTPCVLLPKLKRLSENFVDELRQQQEEADEGATLKELAQSYNVGLATISHLSKKAAA
jgi:hypothetical protein